MNTLDVHLKLNNLHCFDEGDGIGSAEPYLWTVFFKIDGDTTFVNTNLTLEGTATVVSTPGDHGDLPNHDVDPGENVAIPPSLGEFNTQLKPIPLQQPAGDVTEVGGVVGLITVLMEQDNTPNSAIAKGHDALNQAVQDSLNALIPTLSIAHREPSDAEIAAMETQIGDKVSQTIEDNVSFWDWLGGFGNMDDKIGSTVFRFSHSELEDQGVSGISMRKRFENEGDWEIQGAVTAFPQNATTGSLHVSLSGVPGSIPTQPVHVAGPGFSKSLNKTTTFAGLLPGTYIITAHEFTTGQINKPTCRIHTPNHETEQTTVTTGQIANASVGYSSASCNA